MFPLLSSACNKQTHVCLLSYDKFQYTEKVIFFFPKTLHYKARHLLRLKFHTTAALISLACFFFSCAWQKGSHRVPPAQAPQAETMETGDKNGNVSQHHTLFCEESLGKIDEKDVKLFWNESVRKFYCLKALISSMARL